MCCSVIVAHGAVLVELMDFAHPIQGAPAQVCLQQTGTHADVEETGHLVKSIAGGFSFQNDLGSNLVNVGRKLWTSESRLTLSNMRGVFAYSGLAKWLADPAFGMPV